MLKMMITGLVFAFLGTILFFVSAGIGVATLDDSWLWGVGIGVSLAILGGILGVLAIEIPLIKSRSLNEVASSFVIIIGIMAGLIAALDGSWIWGLATTLFYSGFGAFLYVANKTNLWVKPTQE